VTLHPLGAILDLCGLDGLPLHIRGVIRAARTQRHDVIDDVALAWAVRAAGSWAGMRGAEVIDLSTAARVGISGETERGYR